MDNLIPFGNYENLKMLNIEINYTRFCPEKFSKFLKNNRRPLKKLGFKKPELISNRLRSYYHFTAELSPFGASGSQDLQDFYHAIIG